MTEKRFEPTWELQGDKLVVWLSPKRIYTEKKALWEDIWRAYSRDGQALQVNQICRSFNIARKRFLAIKDILGLTHSSTPFPPWIMNQADTNDLVEQTLEQREEDYEKKLAARSPDWFKRKYLEALNKLADQDRMVKALQQAMANQGNSGTKHSLPKIDRQRGAKHTLLLNLADWHIGRVVFPRMTVTSKEYGFGILTRRVEQFLTQFLEFYRLFKGSVRELVVASLGDMADDPHAMVFPDQAAFQDKRDIEQVRSANDLFTWFFEELLRQIPLPIKVIAVRGNHGPKGGELAAMFDQLLFDPLLKNKFASEPRLTIESSASFLSTHRVGNSLLAFMHGRNIGSSLSEAKALRIAALAELANPAQHSATNKYVFLGHLHHRKSYIENFKETQGMEWIWCPSLVGGDEYSERTLFTTSRPAQMACLVHPDRGVEVTRTFYVE